MADDSFPLPIISRKQARALGLKRFFTGKPCKQGHVAERGVAGGCCIVCREARVKAWNATNPKRRKVTRERWLEQNRERDLQSKRNYAARHREHLNAKSKEYYQTHKVEHAAVVRAWKDRNRDKVIVYAVNARARKYGWAGSMLTVEHLTLMRDQQQGCCAYCRTHCPNRLVFEHVAPAVHGGGWGVDNTVLACRRCNVKKGYHPLRHFLDRLRRETDGVATEADVMALLAVDWRK